MKRVTVLIDAAEIWSVFWNEGREDFNAIVRAGSVQEATAKMKARGVRPVRTTLFTAKDMVELGVTPHDVQQMDLRGYHVYDSGSSTRLA